MKKFARLGKSLLVHTLALTLMLPLLSLQAKAAIDIGKCGAVGNEENVQWSYDPDTTTLTISGTGAMADYTSQATQTTAPWKNYYDTITKVEIGEGVTNIGNYAFYKFTKLENSVISHTVGHIGEYAFGGCTTLKNLSLPDSVTTMGDYALYWTGLSDVKLPSQLREIPDGLFRQCEQLKSVTIPDRVTSIGYEAFLLTENISSITIPANVTWIAPGALGYGSIDNVTFSGLTPPNSLVEGSSPPTGPYEWLEGLESPTVIRHPYSEEWEAVKTSDDASDKNITWETYHEPQLTTTIDDSNPAAPVITIQSMTPFHDKGLHDTSLYVIGKGAVAEPRVTVASISGSTDHKTVSITLNLDPAAFDSDTEITVSVAEEAFVYPSYSMMTENVLVNYVLANLTIPATAPPDPDLPDEPDPPAVDPEPDNPTEPDTPTEPEKPEEPDTPEEPEKPTPPNHSGSSGGGSSGGGSNSGGSSSSRTKTETVKPEEVLPPVVAPPTADKVCTIQHIAKVGEYVDWVERVSPPDYALQLYDALVMASNDKAPSASLGRITDYLVQDRYFTIDPNAPAGTDTPYQVDTVEEVIFGLSELYASEAAALDSVVFESDVFNIVDVANGDRVIDYANLQLGSAVLTGTFNGIFVTKIPRGSDFDTRKKEVCSYTGTVFHAFDRDHPEVFWLSGKCKIRIITVANPATGAQEAYFFLALADNSGFTMRSPAWTAPGTVSEGLMRRDSAVNQILRNITATDAAGQVRQLNTYLTEHNEYNTTNDLTSISNEPHECLVALEGRTGQNGPVCDGYARAFKVLCDRLGIPCVLENGYARSTAQASGTFHMWNSVQINGNWYGADITWDDPIVKGVSGAKSGYENDRYLLVGSTTEIRGIAFSNSHPATNQAAKGGVSFDNGPALSPIAFSGATVEAPASSTPFADVANGAWYADSVQYVYDKKLMQGVSETAFQPESQSTRQQMWMILARLSGEKPASMGGARMWAMGYGVSDGTNPGSPVTRQQMVAYLYRYCQMLHCAGTASGSLSGYPDASGIADYAREAYAWAEGNGILADAFQGALKPEQPASRAEFAVLLHRLCESSTGTQLISSLMRFGNL